LLAMMRLHYLDQDCDQTLRDALAEYFVAIPGLLAGPSLGPETAELMLRHDIGHVVFGCDTTVRGEPLTDVWQVLGTDVRLRDYLRYTRLPETRKVFAQAGWSTLVTATLAMLPGVVTAAWRAWRMRRKWPFWTHEA
jgi:hypothetical protein